MLAPAAVQAEDAKQPPSKPHAQGNVAVTVDPIPDWKPSADQIAKWNQPIKGFHPIKRMLRPVWKLRQEANDLQKDLQALQKPMNGLEPAFKSLEGKMQGVEGNMGGLLKQLGGMNDTMNRLSLDLPKIYHISEDLGQVHHDLQDVINLHKDIREVTKVRSDIQDMSVKMRRLEGPLNQLHAPLISVLPQLKEVQSSVGTVSERMVNIQTQVGEMQGQLATLSEQMGELKAPVTKVSNAPLDELKTELSELNGLLKTMLLLSVVLASATFLSCIVGFIFLYRLKHDLPTDQALKQLSASFRKRTTEMNISTSSELSATVAKNSDFKL